MQAASHAWDTNTQPVLQVRTGAEIRCILTVGRCQLRRKRLSGRGQAAAADQALTQPNRVQLLAVSCEPQLLQQLESQRHDSCCC